METKLLQQCNRVDAHNWATNDVLSMNISYEF